MFSLLIKNRTETTLKKRIDSVLSSPIQSYLTKFIEAENRISEGSVPSDLSYIRRHNFMKWVFKRITNQCTSDIDVVCSVIKFVQKYFYHHIFVQPLSASGSLITDPIQIFWGGYGQCTTINRIVVDILTAGNIEACLLEASSHISAEVKISDTWYIIDPDIFGISYNDNFKPILKTNEALTHPSILDRIPSYLDHQDSLLRNVFDKYSETSNDIPAKSYNCPFVSSVYFARDGFVKNNRAAKFRRHYRNKKMNDDPGYGWDNTQIHEYDVPVVDYKWKPSPVILRNGNLFQYPLILCLRSSDVEYVVQPIPKVSSCLSRLLSVMPQGGTLCKSLSDAIDCGRNMKQYFHIYTILKNDSSSGEFIYYLPSELFLFNNGIFKEIAIPIC
jgi:hypothetical protein